MTHDDFVTESRLRRDALDAQPGAIAVLADFYEERGQTSRAELWRRTDRDEKTDRERDRTCIKKIAHPSPIDPRRDAMIWILCLSGLTFAAIGTAFKLSRERARGVANRVDREIYFAARSERLRTDPATRRLRAAGAILVQTEAASGSDPYLAWHEREARESRERILHTEVPPASWPYTRPHEKQRRDTADR